MPERKKGKHLTLSDREEIQRGLREHRTFAEIAYRIGCSPDTVSKEIRKHRYHKKREGRGYLSVRITPNRCKYRYTCRHRDVCNRKKGQKCRIPCRECLQCNRLCPHFVDSPCDIEHRPPYVCNNCTHSKRCLFDKYLYNAAYAHKEYVEERSSSRRGIDMTRDELAELDALVSPLIMKGQPIAHIMRNHSSEIRISERSLYNYVEKGYLTARKMDLRRAVRYRPRKKNCETVRISAQKAGRQYSDYMKLKEVVPECNTVEMDTVEGKKGGKVLQTFHFVSSGFMIAVIHDNKEMASMKAGLDYLEEALGLESFREMFPLILTDNGSEFANPLLFEYNSNGESRTSMYYCRPRQPQQKGSIEKNHEYIRYVVPKGESFDSFTQEDINLMMNHINSTVRPRFGKTPYEIMAEQYGEESLRKIGMKSVDCDEVKLNPGLIR